MREKGELKIQIDGKQVEEGKKCRDNLAGIKRIGEGLENE